MPTQRAAPWKLPLWSSSLARRTSHAPDLRSSTGDQLSKVRTVNGPEVKSADLHGTAFPAVHVDVLQQLMRGSAARLSALATRPAQQLPGQGCASPVKSPLVTPLH
jgi:hypothetical protein